MRKGTHMSDTSQGEGWWRASDGKWYPPESHPDYVPPAAPVAEPPPVPPAPEPVAPPITPDPIQSVPPIDPGATVAVPAQSATPPITSVPAAPAPGLPPTVPPGAAPIPPVPGGASAAPSGPFNAADNIPWFVIIGGGVLLFIGLILPWASVDLGGGFSESISGLDTDDGKIMLVLALAIIGVGVVHMLKRAQWAFIALIVLALAALGLTIFEITDISGTDGLLGASISVGIGLWVDLIGSLAALGGVIWSRVADS